MNNYPGQEFNTGIHSLWQGADEQEQKRQVEKKPSNAHYQFSQMSEEQKKRKREKQHAKQKNKNKEVDIVNSPGQVYETKPLFVQLVKPNNEEIVIDIDEYIEQEYAKKQEFIKYFPQENDYGQTEHKLRLADPDAKRLTQLTTQMNFRLTEGNGIAYYKIGVEDSGNPLGLCKQDMLCSLKTLCTMAQSLKAELLLLGINQAIQGKTAEVMVRRGLKDGIKMDIRVLLLGDSGSGKTSLLGVLSTGQLDNGEGLARMKFLKNEKEITSGKSARVSHTVIGFDSEGKIVNHENAFYFSQESMIERVVDMSTKLITFIDMGATKRAHNQMIQIVNSQFPDYALLTISANQSIEKSTLDYFKLIQIQSIPFMIALSHIDLASDGHIFDLINHIKQLIAQLQIQSIPIVVRTPEDAVLLSKQIYNKLVIPIFLISNLKQETLDLFIRFLNLLPSTNELLSNSNMHSEYCIHNIFDINNQKVLGGTVLKGVIRVKQILQIGPDRLSRFFPIEIEEIQCNRVQVKSAQCGQICTVRFKKTPLSMEIGSDQNPIRTGMVLIDGKTNPQAVWDFFVEIWLFDNEKEPKRINASFEPVVNTQSTRQICKIIIDDQLTQPIKLTKKMSKSIDQSQQKQYIQRVSYRKASEQIKSIKSSLSLTNKDARTSPKRKISTQIQTKENPIKNDLFIISETHPKEFIELKPNQPNLLRLKFKYFPEYLTVGMKLIINEPNLQGWGIIKQINY